MNKLFTYLILSIFLISLISATAQLNSAYDLTISCEGYTCSSMNVTIFFPNSSKWIDNQPMTNNNYYANYTITPPINGDYSYFYSDGTNSSQSYFTTTTTGNELNTAQGILYALMGLILVVIFLVSLYGGIKLPFKNVRNAEDEVIDVNWKKYLKIFSWGMSYLTFNALVFIIWNLVYAYAQWTNVGTFFYYLWRLMMSMTTPVLVGVVVLAAVNYVDDKKIDNFIKKTGLYYNG